MKPVSLVLALIRRDVSGRGSPLAGLVLSALGRRSIPLETNLRVAAYQHGSGKTASVLDPDFDTPSACRRGPIRRRRRDLCAHRGTRQRMERALLESYCSARR